MKDSTIKLHRHFIRALRGMLNAWERWLDEAANEAESETQK